MNGKFFGKVFLLWAIFIASLMTAAAQTTSISGTVSGSNGAAIIGATVKALNIGSGSETTVVADGGEKYSFADLPTGRYRISAETAGFATGAETVLIEQGASAT